MSLAKHVLQIFSQNQCFTANITLRLPRPSVCFAQVRHGHSRTPPRHNKAPWLVKKKTSPLEHDLTPESKAFLRQAALFKYKNTTPSPLRDEPWERNSFTPNTRRTGVIGIKIGVIPQWKRDGTKILCQLVQVVDNHVIRYTPPEQYEKSLGFNPHWRGKGFGSVVVGALSCTPFNFTKAYTNLFLEAGVPPKRIMSRFWITPDAAVQPGTPLSVMHFKPGDYVDVSAKTVARGFQGVVKRWGYKGGPASHGATKFHRKPGSMSAGKQTGMWKGTKMPGLMGNRWRITKGIKIWRINTKLNILYLGTGCPGPHHGYMRIYDTGLRHRQETREERLGPVVMPTFYKDDIKEDIPENIYDDELFNFGDTTIQFTEEKEN
ncbi:39S ribosomal protein L3, mitochondrial-like [Mya arenaria]|uniref:39S ribosomal protein L3, mitochondrial-like n=1 Tax=Mya arenaria TaxID=6604 RepID=UPI0022E1BCB9|nr:39S ribosomal protein L3, mitochondrial-like [Mya arenaria]